MWNASRLGLCMARMNRTYAQERKVMNDEGVMEIQSFPKKVWIIVGVSGHFEV